MERFLRFVINQSFIQNDQRVSYDMVHILWSLCYGYNDNIDLRMEKFL